MIELETERLFLRNGAKTRPTAAQIERNYERYVSGYGDFSITLEQYKDESNFAYLNARRGSVFGYYNIYPKNMEDWVGHCSFYTLLCEPEVVTVLEGSEAANSSVEIELGWAILKKYRNVGYATEGAKAMIQYGFGELNVRRIVALTERNNAPSLRVMEKVGMSLLEHPVTDGVIGMVYNA